MSPLFTLLHTCIPQEPMSYLGHNTSCLSSSPGGRAGGTWSPGGWAGGTWAGAGGTWRAAYGQISAPPYDDIEPMPPLRMCPVPDHVPPAHAEAWRAASGHVSAPTYDDIEPMRARSHAPPPPPFPRHRWGGLGTCTQAQGLQVWQGLQGWT